MDLNRIFQVSEFNEFINHYLDAVGQVVIEGEISELKLSQNKWVFGAIKDANASVQIFGTVFQLSNIRQLEEGMLVKVVGTPRLYEKTGQFSVSVTQIIPSGEGALRRAFEKLKAQFEAEGLFDLSRKRPLPQFPQKIGLITAKGSQAYNDFVKVLANRMGGISIVFAPVLVQGTESPRSIAWAIAQLNHNHPDLDLVVLTRGGGSLEDLIGFNDEQVVRAVFGSKIPVVSAVGHEGDWSLTDLVADLRASTPSNAAELVVRDREALIRDLNHTIEVLEWKLREKATEYSQSLKASLQTISHYIEGDVSTISQAIFRFSQLFDLFVLMIREKAVTLNGLERLLESLDHKAILKRGFSITYAPNGSIIKNVRSLTSGDRIRTVLAEGSVESTVDGIQS